MLVQSTWPLMMMMMMRGVTHNVYLGRYGMWIYEKSQVVKLRGSTCRQEGTEIVAAFPAMSDIRMTWRDRNPAALPQIPQGAAPLRY